MNLSGTHTALITPFLKNGEIDYEALQSIVEEQANLVEGVVPCGTTGESPTLSHKEHREVIAKTVEWGKNANSNLIVIAGTGSNSTREAIELTNAAAKDGADFALVVNPYYNKPGQTGLLAHFRAIADASDVPIILYNIPGRTGVSLSLDTIVELAAHPNIVAIKEATGDLGFITQVVASTPDDFTVLSGDDNLLLPVLSVGGSGIISVTSNVFPEAMAQVTRKWLANDIAGARELFFEIFPAMSHLFLEVNPIPVKYAMSLAKNIENIVRLPLTPLAPENCEKLRKALEACRYYHG